MTDYKLISYDPTPEMVSAAEDAYMPFGDMEMAIRMALLAAPAVQGEPVECSVCRGKGYRVAPFDIVLTCPHCQGSGKCPAPQPAEQQPAQSLTSKLEAPATIDCWSCGAPVLLDDRADADGNCPYCSVELDLEEYLRVAMAQPAPDVTQLVEALESLIKGYVGLLESGKDRITSLGGDCDPVPVMEQNDPWLRDARAALAAHRKGGES